MLGPMKLYYVTDQANAEAISRNGSEGEIDLKDEIGREDWSADRAIIEVSSARDISQFALTDCEMPHRMWRVPAKFINRHAKRRRILVSPKLKHLVERISLVKPDRREEIVKIAKPEIIKEMIDCLQHMRPRQKKRADGVEKRVRRKPLDHSRAVLIVHSSLLITWKWIVEDQYRDASRFRYDEERKQALHASKLIFRLSNALGLAASQNLALRKKLEQPVSTVDFDREMLEGWLLEIVELTGGEFEKLPEAFNSIEVINAIQVGEHEIPLWLKLPGGRTARDILLAWEAMHPIVRSEVERRLRNEPTRSILSALTRIPVLIDQEWKALKAARLPHVRVLLRRLDALLRQHGLGFGALASEHGKKSWSQRFSCLAQEAFGALAVPITRNHIQDERRREKNRTKRMPAKRQANPHK
jgi:hypothetical protein